MFGCEVEGKKPANGEKGAGGQLEEISFFTQTTSLQRTASALASLSLSLSVASMDVWVCGSVSAFPLPVSCVSNAWLCFSLCRGMEEGEIHPPTHGAGNRTRGHSG